MLNAMEIRNALGMYANYLRGIAANPDQIVEDQFDALPLEVKQAAVDTAQAEFTKLLGEQQKSYESSQKDIQQLIASVSAQTVESLTEARVRVDELATLDADQVIGSIQPADSQDASAVPDATGSPA